MHAEQFTTTKGSIRYRPIVSADSLADIQDENIGFCTACGAFDDCTEPDARGYECEECTAPARYGMEALILRGFVRVTE